MRSSLVSRRVLGLAAAGVLGLSTLAMPGVALADPEPLVPPIITAPLIPPTPTDLPATTSPTSEPEVLAAAPAAPTGGQYYVGSDYIVVTIQGATARDFEYRLNGSGSWLYKDGTLDGTVAHASIDVSAAPTSVEVRNIDGPDHSSAVALTVIAPVAAPTNLTVVPGPSSLTVDWDAPAANGSTYPVGGYEVYISPVGAEYGGGNGCSVDAPVTVCTFSVPDNFEYDVTVVALDQLGYSGGDVRMRSAKVLPYPTPTAVPTKDDGDITGPAGAISTLSAGQKVVLQGDKFVAGTTVRLTMFSTPVDLGSVVVASDGTFSATVTIPANLANGTHTLVATGMGEDGAVRNLVITVTVSGGQATLATTGFDAVPVALGGGLFLLAGAGLVVGARRRSTNA